jgi:hypothetical protein
MITLAEMIEEVRVELRRRLHVYPALVAEGKMEKDAAAIKIERMRAVIDALAGGIGI